VKCVNAGCPWRVHAFKGRWKSNWKCSIVIEHTCLLSEVLPSHRNISCDFVAKQIYVLIMDNLNYESKMIVRHIEQTYQYTISCLKAWRAKQRVFEMRFSTYETSYDNLPRMLSQVAARNPRCFYDTYLVQAVKRGQNILKRAFFFIGVCVGAFQCCLQVIYINDTFLTGRYK